MWITAEVLQLLKEGSCPQRIHLKVCVMRRVADLNACFADAAALALKVEITAEETFLNALEGGEARSPVWRIKCTVFEELGK